MKPGSKNLFHTEICDDSLDITFWGIYDTDYFIAKDFKYEEEIVFNIR